MRLYEKPVIRQVDVSLSERVASAICQVDGITWVWMGSYWKAFAFESPSFSDTMTSTKPGCVVGVYVDGLRQNPPPPPS